MLRQVALATIFTALAGFSASASAETVGLRISPRGQVLSADSKEPASLRFTIANMDLSYRKGGLDTSISIPQPVSPLLLGLPQDSLNTRNGGMRADWFPFDSGLHTSAGLVWSDNSRRSGNLFDNGRDGTPRSRAFLGLGWTASASSSSTGSGWRLDADVGASLSSPRDCLNSASQCLGLGTAGLKPDSGGDGIRWNPFISIGASYQY